MSNSKIFSVVFDENSAYWTKDPVCNEYFIKTKMNYLGGVFTARGYLFVRDILEELGIPVQRSTIDSGWHHNGEMKKYHFKLISFMDDNHFIITFKAENDIRKYF